MQTLTSFDPNTEVNGRMILTYVDCIDKEIITPLLEKHGLSDVQFEQWYPLQAWLDVLSDLMRTRDGIGAMFDMVAIGIKVAETVQKPPEIYQMPFVQFMMGFNHVHEMNHRYGDAGQFEAELVKPQHLKMMVRIPYPDDMLYGGMYGETRSFLPSGTVFKVEYDKDIPRRSQGGDTTVLHIKWGEAAG